MLCKFVYLFSLSYPKLPKQKLPKLLIYFTFQFFIVHDFDIPRNEKQCREKLREEFAKYKDVTDIRVIDMLVVKGQMELKESVNIWKQKSHLMKFWKETTPQKPTDFLSKFFSGSN